MSSSKTKPVIFSGMQPSDSSLHIGNYIGALKHWIHLQEKYQAYFCVVNSHAITVPQDPKLLPERTRSTAAQYIAAGIDPQKSCLFIQSQVAAHAELAWILNGQTGFGEASRMTQFKDKSSKNGAEKSSVGLFTYPILMAADILLYQTDVVPVGEDQKQHVELARDLADRFNKKFGETFTKPKPLIAGVADNDGVAKIYDLQSPQSKMSKSGTNINGIVSILDDPAINHKKIMRAVTDTDTVVSYDFEKKPGISNLLNIAAELSGISVESLVQTYGDSGYGVFKRFVADTVADVFSPIRQKTLSLLSNSAELDEILVESASQAKLAAEPTIDLVYKNIGLIR